MEYLGLRIPKTLHPCERDVSNHYQQFSCLFLPQIHSHQAFAHTSSEKSHLPRSPIKSVTKSDGQFSVFLFFCLIITTFDAVNHSLFLEVFSSLNFQDTTLSCLCCSLCLPGLFFLISPISKWHSAPRLTFLTTLFATYTPLFISDRLMALCFIYLLMVPKFVCLA